MTIIIGNNTLLIGMLLAILFYAVYCIFKMAREK